MSGAITHSGLSKWVSCLHSESGEEANPLCDCCARLQVCTVVEKWAFVTLILWLRILALTVFLSYFLYDSLLDTFILKAFYTYFRLFYSYLHAKLLIHITCVTFLFIAHLCFPSVTHGFCHAPSRAVSISSWVFLVAAKRMFHQYVAFVREKNLLKTQTPDV